MLSSLVANFAVVGLFAAFWIRFQDWAVAQPERWSAVAFGVLMGGVAIVSLNMSVDVGGYYVDLRAVPVAVAALVGGWLAGLIAACLAIIARFVVGGPGMSLGAVSILLACVCGLVGFVLMRLGRTRFVAISTAALLTGTRSLVLLPFLSPEARDISLSNLPLTLPINIVGVLAIGYAILRGRDRARHRALLLGTVAQAPDFFYVKDPDSRIVAVNKNVARIHGFTYPWQLEGKSDVDLELPDRARALMTEEQMMLSSGTRIHDKAEDIISARSGQQHSYVTSKSPVYAGNGNLLGLVGVSKDVTALKDMQRELAESRDRLDFVLHEMSDGVCLYDAKGTILLSNSRYQELFPKTGHLRVPGVFLPAILQAVLDTEEQPDALTVDPKQWMAESMAALRDGGDQLIQLFDGRWVRLRTRAHSNGVAIMVASDITSMKRAEIDLVTLTKQLELLSLTDGLTQLVNRRGFDGALQKELARAKRSDKSLSVILLDVDRFKLFNDRYGHLEGDECLRKVAAAVQRGVIRPGDTVARYGGEEFAVILPDTTPQGAYQVAENIRREIRSMAIPHASSEMEVVTASLGFASADPQDPAITDTLLLARADDALYRAKADGRDRSLAWFDPQTDLPIVAYLPSTGKASA